LEGIFGKQDEMRGHMMEVELPTLDPKSFNNIQYFFTKFKDLLSQLKACRLINLRRRNKWFSPLSPNLVLNYPYSYPHSILSDSPLEPPGRCLILMTLSNP
jgi:hypothetical protein